MTVHWIQEGFFNRARDLFPRPGSLLPIATRTELHLGQLQDSLIIFHAEWSGYSYKHMALILNALASSSWARKTVVICRYDGFTRPEVLAILGADCNGYAESVLVRGGQTIARHLRLPDLEPFLQTIREQV